MVALRIAFLLSMLCFPHYCQSSKELLVNGQTPKIQQEDVNKKGTGPTNKRISLKDCMHRKLRIHQLKALEREHGIEAVAKRICGKMEGLKRCLVEHVHSIFPCEPYGRNMTEKLLNHIIKYACSSNGGLLTRILNRFDCIFEKNLDSKLQQCFFNPLASVNSTESSIFCPTSEEGVARLYCWHLSGAIECSANIVSECDDKYASPSGFLRNMSDYIKNNTHCTKYTKESLKEFGRPTSYGSTTEATTEATEPTEESTEATEPTEESTEATTQAACDDTTIQTYTVTHNGGINVSTDHCLLLFVALLKFIF